MPTGDPRDGERTEFEVLDPFFTRPRRRKFGRPRDRGVDKELRKGTTGDFHRVPDPLRGDPEVCRVSSARERPEPVTRLSGAPTVLTPTGLSDSPDREAMGTGGEGEGMQDRGDRDKDLITGRPTRASRCKGPG